MKIVKIVIKSFFMGMYGTVGVLACITGAVMWAGLCMGSIVNIEDE